MKRTITFVSVLALAALVASPAAATTTKHRTHPSVTCQRIKDAIAAGKTSDEVEKDMHTTAARVKQCTTPAPAHAKQAAPAPAK